MCFDDRWKSAPRTGYVFGIFMSFLHPGQFKYEKFMATVLHLVYRTVLMHVAWNTCERHMRMIGESSRPEKQIMQDSSLVTLISLFKMSAAHVTWQSGLRQGKQFGSPLTPSHSCPHSNILLQYMFSLQLRSAACFFYCLRYYSLVS